MLEIKIGNVFTDIEGDFPPDLYSELERKMSFRPKDYMFSVMYNRWIMKDGKRIRRMWDGWKRQIWKARGKAKVKRAYFPTGLFSIAQGFLSNNEIDYTITDCRIRPASNIDLSFCDQLNGSPFSFYDYQDSTVDKSCKLQRGIIQVATGGGKTVMAAGIIVQLGVCPFIFFVTSIDLLIQAKESFEELLLQNGKPIKVGQIGGGIIDIQDINVMTVQTAVRVLGKKWDKDTKFDSEDSDDKTPIESRREDIVELLHTAKGCICDEVQHWKADTCQLVAKSLHQCYYTYGASATPYRDDGDDLMIQACFGKKIVEISASDLIKGKWLIKPSIKWVNIKGEKSQFRQFQQIYKDQVSENEEYNQTVASIANAFIENKRLILVLVQQINHGKALAKIIPGAVFVSGKSAKKKRKEAIDQLRNKEISCIISTVIFDEGIDVRPLDTVILAGQGKSRVRAMQRIGRILRTFPGKEAATAIDFRIHQKYLLNHAKERNKMYKTEPEFHIEEINP